MMPLTRKLTKIFLLKDVVVICGTEVKNNNASKTKTTAANETTPASKWSI